MNIHGRDFIKKMPIKVVKIQNPDRTTPEKVISESALTVLLI